MTNVQKLRRMAEDLIHARRTDTEVASYFISAAEKFRFDHLLKGTKEIRNLPKDNPQLFDSKLLNSLLPLAHYIVGNYDELFFERLALLKIIADQSPTDDLDVFQTAMAIYDLSHYLDIQDFKEQLSQLYWEGSELVVPDESKHLFAKDLLTRNEKRMRELGEKNKEKLACILSEVRKRFGEQHED